MGSNSEVNGGAKMTFVDFRQIPGVQTYPSVRTNDVRGSFINFLSKPSDEDSKFFNIENIAISVNELLGTVRGIHIQKQPFVQEKLIRCIKGSIFDIIVDLRKNSPTYLAWGSLHLSDQDEYALYLPEGVAHGYQTLENDTILMYGLTSTYNSEAAIHISPTDKDLGIPWPLAFSAISPADSKGLKIQEAIRDSNW
jgi:dTDP-4-dehydrorhamnose 3,5-epimerase